MNSQLQNDIKNYVQNHAQEQLDFVTDLCNLNSYTTNKDGTDCVATILLDCLGGIFSSHEITDQTHTGNHHILRNCKKGPYIMLVGHLDTVFPPDHKFQSCRLQGDRLIGPGTADMKGGLAVLVYALKALNNADLLDRIPVTLLLNSDEEIGSKTSHALFESEKQKATVCLVGECGGPDGSVVVSRNGKAGARIRCYGQERHVGAGSHEKSSAILEAAHKVIEVESLNDCLPGVSVNVGQIEGGLGPSTIPGETSFLMDVRWKQEDHYSVLLKKIQDCLSRPVQSSCTCDIEVLNGRPAMPLTDSTQKIFSLLQGIGRSMGMKIVPEHRRGTSDANFFGAAGIPTLDGFGPVGDRDHTPEEYILWPTLASRTVLLSSFIATLAKQKNILKN
jgi:glutamate carboxypeptidase